MFAIVLLFESKWNFQWHVFMHAVKNNAWLVVTSRKVSTCIGYILAYQQLWVIPGAYGGSYAPGNTPEGGMSNHQGTLWAHRYDLFVVYREEH